MIAVGTAYTIVTSSEPAYAQNTRLPLSCVTNEQGDADCNSKIDSADYTIWRDQYMGKATAGDADFNDDEKIDLNDFEIWRRGSIAGNTPTPSPTDEVLPCQCDLHVVTQNNCAANTTPICTGKFSCECRATTTITPTVNPTITVTPTRTPTPSPTTPPTGTGYTTSGGKIYKGRTVITLKGVNWFGGETPDHVVHGLWAREWKSMIAQMKTLGFNAVRIPFCPDTIRGTSVSTVDYSKNPDLNGLNSLQVMDKLMDEFNRQQMYVLLDHHTYDCYKTGGNLPEVWYSGTYPGQDYTETMWISDLKTVANRYKNRDYFMGIDLKNEPHKNTENGSYGAHWGSNSAANDWNKAAERAGKAILQDAPTILIFVEGIGNYQPTTAQPSCNLPTGEYVFWGENLAYAKCVPIAASEIPANKVVYSPHVYGPDVGSMSYFNDSTFPNNMPAIWDRHFGVLKTEGYTLVPGEWGGKYDQHASTSPARRWQDAIVAYFKNKGICNSFHWSWNPNSGDTGGILQDDWQTPWPQKMVLLNDYYMNCTQ